MGKQYVYSYKLTYFGGTAPCFDNDLLSLAICKPVMRRVMGRAFKDDHDSTYWFVGLVGKGLDDNRELGFSGRAGQILYLAKLTDVKDFAEYFSDPTYKSRKDHIYEECKEGSKNSFYSSGKYFRHVDRRVSEVHIDADSQIKDWDVKFEEKYVLLSEQYYFPDQTMSDEIISKLEEGQMFAGSRPHICFETADDSPLIKEFESIVADPKNHGQNNLPVNFQNNCSKGCRR